MGHMVGYERTMLPNHGSYPPRRREGGRIASILRLSALLLAALLGAGATAVRGQIPNEPPSFPGFPLLLAGEGNLEVSQPVVAELGTLSGGTAGYKEIIFATRQGKLHVLHRRSSNGNWEDAPGFPVTVGTYIVSSPA